MYERVFDKMIKPKESLFQEHVLELVKLIPPGRVTSYGAIAKALGTSGSARIVGWILGHSKNHYSIPAHRVVNRVGLLTGRFHFQPPEKMQELLEKEGVKVVDNQVVDFDNFFWNPMEELI